MVEPNEIKKCSFQKKFLNIYGKVINLTLLKQDNVVGVTLKQHSDIMIHSILYGVITILNAISFKLNFISAALFIIISCILVFFIYLKSGTIIEGA